MRAAAALPILLALAAPARAQRWVDATAGTIGTTAEWTNKVALVDVDGDGRLDAVLANGRGYSSPGPAEASRVFRNTATGFVEITSQVFGAATGHARVIKLADIDGDGDDDIFVGNTYGDPSRLYRKTPTGWADISAQLPTGATPWVGDAEFGDVDNDGDLDLALADWGTDLATGAPPRLYINDGTGAFVDATATNVPPIAVPWSWELDFVDVDGDFALDLAVASKLGTTSVLLRNDGYGSFTDATAALPHFGNNYDFEAMDIDGDGDTDLVTLNDGPSLRNHVFVNNFGSYVDETATRLAGSANPAADDNQAAFLDVDSDGDPDLVVGSLTDPDRLLLNDGTGVFALATGAIPGSTPGTLGIALGDIDGDRRADLLMGQGEAAFPDRLYRATDMVAADATPPVARVQQVGPGDTRVHAWVHDFKSGVVRGDFTQVVLRYDSGQEAGMTWTGEYRWTGAFEAPGYHEYQVCATDAAGNEGCSEWAFTFFGGDDVIGGGDVGDYPDAGGHGHEDGHGGCVGCSGAAPTGGGAVLALLVALGLARPRRRSAWRVE